MSISQNFSNLPVRQVSEPIIAYKAADLWFSSGIGFEFKPLNSFAKPYKAIDVAICRKCNNPPYLKDNDSKNVGNYVHNCGFYAVKDITHKELVRTVLRQDTWGVCPALLEVELSGRIISCKKGYRASQQRVKKINIDPWCVECRITETEMMIFGLDAHLASYCISCFSKYAPPGQPTPWRAISLTALASKYECEVTTENFPQYTPTPP